MKCSEIMSKNIEWLGEKDTIARAATVMAEAGIGFLPICDLSAGVVSIADVIEHAPKREALETLKAVLWREALGPRAGAARGAPLLKDAPPGPRVAERDLPHTKETVFSGGHRGLGSKEFPS